MYLICLAVNDEIHRNVTYYFYLHPTGDVIKNQNPQVYRLYFEDNGKGCNKSPCSGLIFVVPMIYGGANCDGNGKNFKCVGAMYAVALPIRLWLCHYSCRENKMGNPKSRVLKDIRKHSRISVDMDCRLKSKDSDYKVIMLDISLCGAAISGTFQSSREDIPANGSKVFITLENSYLKKPLTLAGTIKNSRIGMSKQGKEVKFGIKFEDTPLGLLRLISALAQQK